jgi:hypothetical protein
MSNAMRLVRAGLVAGISAAVASLASGPAAADEQADAGFAKRFFAGRVTKPKAYVCFVRRYDAEHLAQHPLQKVGVMKLLITAEKVPDDAYLQYSFRLGVNFRDRPGDFDSSGDCGHASPVRNADTEPMPTAGIDFQCAVDCDGGGISVNLANADNAVIVRLDRIRIWRGKDPDESAESSLRGGVDDRIFRLDRTSLDECRSLVADRKELAAMRHK